MANTQSGNFGMNYVSRGDLATSDFTVGDFTTDGTWYVLDLSGIVPAGSRLVHLMCEVKDSLTDRTIRFRTNGFVNTGNMARCKTVISNVSSIYDRYVVCDANGRIAYMASNMSWTMITVNVKGWLA